MAEDPRVEGVVVEGHVARLELQVHIRIHWGISVTVAVVFLGQVSGGRSHLIWRSQVEN